MTNCIEQVDRIFHSLHGQTMTTYIN